MRPDHAVSPNQASTNYRWVQDYDDYEELARTGLAELVGTFYVVFLGCSAIVTATSISATVVPLTAAIVFGFAYGTLTFFMSKASNSHFNPAITLVYLMLRKMSPYRASVYVVAQFLGAYVAGLMVLGYTSSASVGGVPVAALGTPIVSGGLTMGNAFVGEWLGSAFICLAHLQATTDKRVPTNTSPALFIALAYVVAIAGTYLSGGSVNPARWFGPALASATYGFKPFGDTVWIYWIGPILGAITASLTSWYVLDGVTSGERLAQYAASKKKDVPPAPPAEPDAAGVGGEVTMEVL